MADRPKWLRFGRKKQEQRPEVRPSSFHAPTEAESEAMVGNPYPEDLPANRAQAKTSLRGTWTSNAPGAQAWRDAQSRGGYPGEIRRRKALEQSRTTAPKAAPQPLTEEQRREAHRLQAAKSLNLPDTATWKEITDEGSRRSQRESARAYELPETATTQDILAEQDRRRKAGGDGSPIFRPQREDTRSPWDVAAALLDARDRQDRDREGDRMGEPNKAGQGPLATIKAAEEAGAVPPGTYQRFILQAAEAEAAKNHQ